MDRAVNNIPLCHYRSVCSPVKISDRPQAYVWQNFISKDEARHIAELAAPHLKRSRVGTNHSSIEVCVCFLGVRGAVSMVAIRAGGVD